MKDFTVEEITKIVLFYKNKASDLELAYLELQISNAKELQKQKETSDFELMSHRKVLLEQNQKDVLNFTKQIGKLNSELEKYKTKKTNKKITGK